MVATHVQGYFSHFGINWNDKGMMEDMDNLKDLTLEYNDPFVLYRLFTAPQCVCPGQEVQIRRPLTAFPIIPFIARCQALSGSGGESCFGLSVWLPVSVSGAAGSSDSAGGAAGPSRVQPSPCDTLSVTDPPPRGDTPPPPASTLCSLATLTCHRPPPLLSAIGLFTAALQSLIE